MSEMHYLTCIDENCEKAACVDRRVLQSKLTALEGENERLKETISHLPKVPTQPYEKEIALSLIMAKEEIGRLREALELIAVNSRKGRIASKLGQDALNALKPARTESESR